MLGAARATDLARARGETLGLLAGIPVAVKDNIDTVGFPTSAGTAALKRHFPIANAPVVDALLQQGASVFAKVNMHELAGGGTSSNPVFGGSGTRMTANASRAARVAALLRRWRVVSHRWDWELTPRVRCGFHRLYAGP